MCTVIPSVENGDNKKCDDHTVYHAEYTYPGNDIKISTGLFRSDLHLVCADYVLDNLEAVAGKKAECGQCPKGSDGCEVKEATCSPDNVYISEAVGRGLIIRGYGTIVVNYKCSQCEVSGCTSPVDPQ